MSAFHPLDREGRRVLGAILLIFALSSAVTVALSIRATNRARTHASVLQIAARQQTLAGRYVADVLLARAGARADPALTARTLAGSDRALLNGGEAPEVNGNDDDADLPPATDPVARRQLTQEARLVADLAATGRAILAGRAATAVALTAHERIDTGDAVQRLRILAALSANTALNAERTLAAAGNRGIDHLITLQVALGVIGLIVSLAFAFALIAATRRQTAHFRSIVRASTDLVLVLRGGRSGCVYAGHSVVEMLGCWEQDVLGDGLRAYVHRDDWSLIEGARAHGGPPEFRVRIRDRHGEWRMLEAHVTDLRSDRRVRGVVVNARDVTERVALEHQLRTQATHDDLTGLPNRALLRVAINDGLLCVANGGGEIAVLLIDLDGFKHVNDTLGHDAGDELLREMAARFREVAGPQDTLARLGGDEFVLLLEDATDRSAVAAAEALLEAARQPAHVAGHDFSLSACVGISTSTGSADAASLVRDADIAMYAAKAAGTGHWERFRPELGREAGAQLGLELDLRRALELGELRLHFQPEIDLDDRTVTGVEALLRWTSKSRGTVPPSIFIPVAENTGLIDELGEFALREACAQAAQWRSEDLVADDFVVWVNVSVRQLAAGGVADLVEDVLASAGIPHAGLGIEITESAIVQDGETAENTHAELQQLHARGVRIAIDDFGTGFSSLAQLRHVPIDMLKIDRSFISGVEHDAKDAAITANLISLAHALGSVAIAEGIETAGQLAYVANLGCELGQGTLLSPPLSAPALTELLRDAQMPSARAA
jgi:diguanylate cyclase (GGDEF)-like protein/PAS domain S-box-containing protein